MTDSRKRPAFILTLTCADRPGIVAAVSTILAQAECNIEESSQFGDPGTSCFFMRIRFSAPADLDHAELHDALTPVARRLNMNWDLRSAAARLRLIIMVSKTSHCLNDLLYRWRIGALQVDITRIISNHETLRRTAEKENLAFDAIAVNGKNKPEAEAALLHLIEKDRAELIILARYMQILSPGLARQLSGRVINIHHSFLPGFKGAQPYRQAHARGVKLIGATAHYVTADLDEGPIIEQETERVDHAMSVSDLIGAGRDIERRVLSRAVQYHVEQRVLLNNKKTVVFR